MTDHWHIGRFRLGGPGDVVMHDGLQADCGTCIEVKSANEVFMRRLGTVTVEEMTRRRDEWRRKHGALERQLATARARERVAQQEKVKESLRAARAERDVVKLTERLAAALAEARRYAQECGTLRDRLEEPRKGRDDAGPDQVDP